MTGDIIIIYGPTAAGKSKHALTLAKKIHAENKTPVIINADALQQYRDLPLLSAQPSDDDKKICQHLLYGFLPATADSNVVDWLRLAIAHIDQALKANHVPIVVGGSGLYIKTLIVGLSPMPTVPDDIKKNLMDELKNNPSKLLDYYQQLENADPKLAQKLARQDKTRIVRALSVFLATGKPLSQWQAHPPSGGLLEVFPDKKISYHYIQPPREVLLANITTRTSNMLAHGAVEEYKKLRAKYGDAPFPPFPHLPIDKTIGASVVNNYLHHNIDLQQLQEQIIIETRQYAKRQATWYRGQLQHLFEQ